MLTPYARWILLRWPLIALNSAVLIAIPLHVGHHIVDIISGLFVGVVAILIAQMTLAVVDRSASTAPSSLAATRWPASSVSHRLKFDSLA